jgi:hypothetical protein
VLGKSLLQIFVLLSVASCTSHNTVKLELKENAQGDIVITYNIPKHDSLSNVKLYKTVLDLKHFKEIDIYADPISCISLPSHIYSGTITDKYFCRGYEYSYYISAVSNRTGCPYFCPVKTICVGFVYAPVNTSKSCYLVIDKPNYLLELWGPDGLVKSYPICLGGNPVRRKLHEDNLSTPEGRYMISHVNLKSQYYKALKINYPNSEDMERYNKAKEMNLIPVVDGKILGIGGDIEIHGGGFGNNWTFGCVAMVNEDIDELFSMECIRNETIIYILGSEIGRTDLAKYLSSDFGF